MKKEMPGYHSGRWSKRTLYLFCGLVLFFLNFPIIICVPLSFSSSRFLMFPPPGFSLQWYLNFFSRADWMEATWTSAKIAIFVMVIATSLGTLASYGIVRGEFKGKKIIYAFIVSPLIIPVIIIGLASYFVLAMMNLVGSEIGLALIHATIATPFVVVIVSNTLKTCDVTLEKAAMVMGASRIKTFFRVTLPLIKTGVLSGAFFSFLVSFDELIIVLFIGGIDVVTLPRKIWEGVREEIDPTIAAVATLLTVFSVCILLAAILLQVISEKRTGQGSSLADEGI